MPGLSSYCRVFEATSSRRLRPPSEKFGVVPRGVFTDWSSTSNARQSQGPGDREEFLRSRARGVGLGHLNRRPRAAGPLETFAHFQKNLPTRASQRATPPSAQALASATPKRRSVVRRFGRVTVRLYTASCWRKAKFRGRGGGFIKWVDMRSLGHRPLSTRRLREPFRKAALPRVLRPCGGQRGAPGPHPCAHRGRPDFSPS